MRSPDPERDWLLGVDGGGTKTHFLLCRTNGSEQHVHIGPGAYLPEIGIDGVADVLSTGLAALWGDAGVGPQDIAYAFFGMPAYGEGPQGDAELQQAVAQLLEHDRFRCDNDMVCAWAGSLGGADGINVVAGTGSIAYGERRGVSARCGGWGELFGDEGSAYWTAIHGLRAFACMSDGRLPRGLLHEIFCDRLKLSADIEILVRLLGDHVARKEIAGLAPIVTEAAAAGDAIAKSILLDGAAALALHADVLARSLQYAPEEPIPVSYSGGMFESGDFVQLFGQALQQSSASLTLRPPLHPPHVGAIFAAARYGARSPETLSFQQLYKR